MKTIREAQEIILGHTRRLEAETVPLEEALGRVLAEDVASNRDHPPYDISAMDGYAVRSEDIESASRKEPVVLEVVDDIRAGAEPACDVKSGQASRIMTGAPVPAGADTVIRVEDTDCDEKRVKIFVPAREGANIRRLGENLRKGERVLKSGTEIGPAEVGILAMVKKAKVNVYRRPRVAILSTGDELEGLDEPLDERKIPDANSYTVMAELQAIGVEPVLLGIARDTRESLEEKLRQGLDYDALIVSGGVSVGHHDFVRPTLAALGIQMHFWRVAIRPGHPFAFGTGKDILVFALPGNPVSSMVCCEQFVIPAMRRMLGAKKLFRRTVSATLAEDVKDKKGRIHFMRVVLEQSDGGLVARLAGSQGSGILMSMVNADGLLIMPAECELLRKGTPVVVQLLHHTPFQEEPGITTEGKTGHE